MLGPDDEVDDHREELVDDAEDGEAGGGDGSAARHAEVGDREAERAGKEHGEPHLEREPVKGGV